MDFNREFLEVADIIPAFVPVDMQTAANNGLWVNMKNISRLICVLYKGAGNLGQDPIITLQQATSNAGAGAKALTFSAYRTKLGAIASTGQFTRSTQTASTNVAPVSGANPAVIAVEVLASDLDVNNSFTHVQMSVADTGTQAQLGCAFYIAVGLRYQQVTPPSNI